MRKFFWTIIITITICSSFTTPEPNSYKCMVQLINYTGEGAYIIVSLLDGDDNYKQTLKVLGEDEEWYPDLTEWYEFYKNDTEIDGITGATIAGGERSIFSFEIDPAEMDYPTNKIRFETAVEDQDYHLNDVLLEIDMQSLTGKHDGSGYIRYVKILGK